MCTIHMRVQCPVRFSELVVEDVEPTEHTIVSTVCMALLEVFAAVLVENVTVHPSPEDNDEDGWRW